MLKTRHFAMCAALVAAVVTTTIGSARAADEKERQLIGVLQSDSPRAEKAITCKGLAIYGTKDAVPELAKLLPDEQLTSWARIALEAIPGTEADAALRDAMGKVKGRVLIGVVNSIGVRRDAAAVDALAGLLKDADTGVASAAALALGRIGNAPATKILSDSLAGAPVGVRSTVAEGCILCAEKLLAEGKADEATKLYDQVRKADVPKQRVVEATRGAILARKTAGIPLLVEQLRSTDKVMLNIGLQVARELSGSEVTAALVAELSQAKPDRQALLLYALADRGDATVLPVVLEAAKTGPKQVRTVALGVLGRVGNVSCVPALLEVAIDPDVELAQTAKATLAGLQGKEVDVALIDQLSQAKGKTRQVVIEAVGQRRLETATAALIKAADDADQQTRNAALMALGSTVGLDDLPVLIERFVAPKKPEDAQAAVKALRAASVRMPDGEACAATLAAAMAKSPVAAKCTVLEILGAMGNAKALAIIATAAKDTDPKLQDTASRMLGQWMTLDAAPVLLDLAKTAPDGKYQIRALRGYIRLLRQFPMPDAKRAAMCRAAWDAADRDAEKKLVLQVIARYPSNDMLKMAAELAKTASMKIEIVKAEYGAGEKTKDVTETLQKHVGGLPVIILPSPHYNISLGGDPAPGVVKQLTVQYRINGKSGEATFAEDAAIMLPMP